MEQQLDQYGEVGRESLHNLAMPRMFSKGLTVTSRAVSFLPGGCLLARPGLGAWVEQSDISYRDQIGLMAGAV